MAIGELDRSLIASLERIRLMRFFDRCPVSDPSGKSCKFGAGCRFSRDMHVVDLTVVKTLKVGGK